MKIFELHFNPKAKEDVFFDSFVYEPANAHERKLGSLYEIGELKNAFPPNSRFLDKVAQAIKDRYFTLSFKTPEKALTESLKGANEFLAGELKKENISWLGNLNFAVLALKDFDLAFTKTGDIKILMLRGGAITDIGKSFEVEKIEPYPLKIFFNIVSGKLMERDIILAITKDLYEYFRSQKTLEKLAKAGTLDEKKIKNIFPEEIFSEKEKMKTSGACLLFFLENKVQESKRAKNIFSSRKKKESLLKPVMEFFFETKKRLLKLETISHFLEPSKKLEKKELKKETEKGIKIKVASSDSSTEVKLLSAPKTDRKIYLVLFLLLLLFLGFLIFKKREDKTKLANESLKKTEEENLMKLNNMNTIENPNLLSEPNIIFSFAEEKWKERNIQFTQSLDVSQIALYYSNFYLLDKKYCEIIKVGIDGENPSVWNKEELKQDCSGIKSMAIDGSLWLLNKDNTIDVYRKGAYEKTVRVNIFPLVENITKIEVKINVPYLYLLEPSQKRIIILDKDGKIFKQFFSQKFDNLQDFAVSADGKTIYLLNGNKVYSIEI